MSAPVTAATAETFLKGAFDVFTAMTGRSYAVKTDPAADADAAALAELLGRFPLALRARMKPGGGVALLLAVPEAARLAALIEGKEEGAALADDQAVVAELHEVAGPCLGAGATALLEKAGRTPEQPDDVLAELAGPEAAGRLIEFFGGPPRCVPFTCAAGTFQATGRLLFTEAAELLVSAEDSGDRATPAPQPNLSDAEVGEILSRFAANGATNGAAANGAAVNVTVRTPSNIEMVLDIRLAATARLGRVEMPIGDILGLGPGSIIDVGRLVDEPVELLVNNKLIARGDVVVVDEKFGLRITEIVSPKERIESMH